MFELLELHWLKLITLTPHRRARDAAHPTAHTAAAETDLAALNLGAPIGSTTTGPKSDVTAVNAIESTRDVQETGYQVEETPVTGNGGAVPAATTSIPTKETEVKSAQPVAPVASTPVAPATSAPVAATAEKITATEKPAEAAQTVPAAAASTSKTTTAPKKKKGGLFAACCGKSDHIE